MAASRRHADVLWMENDGGNTPELYAVSPRGRLLARDRVEGAKPTPTGKTSPRSTSAGATTCSSPTPATTAAAAHFATACDRGTGVARGHGKLRPAWSIRRSAGRTARAIARRRSSTRPRARCCWSRRNAIRRNCSRSRCYRPRGPSRWRAGSAPSPACRRPTSPAARPAQGRAAGRPGHRRRRLAGRPHAGHPHLPGRAVLTRASRASPGRRRSRASRGSSPAGVAAAGRGPGLSANGAGLYASGEFRPAPIFWLIRPTADVAS